MQSRSRRSKEWKKKLLKNVEFIFILFPPSLRRCRSAQRDDFEPLVSTRLLSPKPTAADVII